MPTYGIATKNKLTARPLMQRATSTLITNIKEATRLLYATASRQDHDRDTDDDTPACPYDAVAAVEGDGLGLGYPDCEKGTPARVETGFHLPFAGWTAALLEVFNNQDRELAVTGFGVREMRIRGEIQLPSHAQIDALPAPNKNTRLKLTCPCCPHQAQVLNIGAVCAECKAPTMGLPAAAKNFLTDVYPWINRAVAVRPTSGAEELSQFCKDAEDEFAQRTATQRAKDALAARPGLPLPQIVPVAPAPAPPIAQPIVAVRQAAGEQDDNAPSAGPGTTGYVPKNDWESALNWAEAPKDKQGDVLTDMEREEANDIPPPPQPADRDWGELIQRNVDLPGESHLWKGEPADLSPIVEQKRIGIAECFLPATKEAPAYPTGSPEDIQPPAWGTEFKGRPWVPPPLVLSSAAMDDLRNDAGHSPEVQRVLRGFKRSWLLYASWDVDVGLMRTDQKPDPRETMRVQMTLQEKLPLYDAMIWTKLKSSDPLEARPNCLPIIPVTYLEGEDEMLAQFPVTRRLWHWNYGLPTWEAARGRRGIVAATHPLADPERPTLGDYPREATEPYAWMNFEWDSLQLPLPLPGARQLCMEIRKHLAPYVRFPTPKRFQDPLLIGMVQEQIEHGFDPSCALAPPIIASYGGTGTGKTLSTGLAIFSSSPNGQPVLMAQPKRAGGGAAAQFVVDICPSTWHF